MGPQRARRGIRRPSRKEMFSRKSSARLFAFILFSLWESRSISLESSSCASYPSLSPPHSSAKRITDCPLLPSLAPSRPSPSLSITGAGRGLGVDIARTFAEAGANLALTYNATQCDELAASLAKEFGIKAQAFKMPAESSQAVTECVGKVVEEMGQIDIVIANAGICIHRDAQGRPSPTSSPNLRTGG